jgi:hypothetical protein
MGFIFIILDNSLKYKKNIINEDKVFKISP